MEWRREMPAVSSAYEPSGALPATAVLLLLLGSVVGCVAGLFAQTVVGSVGLGLVIGLGLALQGMGIVQAIVLFPLYMVTVLAAYFVTGWVAAWCTTRLGEWGKNRNIVAPLVLSVIASLIPVVFACVCYFNSELYTGHMSPPLEKQVSQTSPLLSLWLFSNFFSVVSTLFGLVIAPATAGYFAVRRVLSVKFCEGCQRFMRASGWKTLSLGCLRALVRAVRKDKLDVAASLLHGPSGEEGEARLYSCRCCSRGYLEVTVKYKAQWQSAFASFSYPPGASSKPTSKKEKWLAVSREVAAPDAQCLRQEFAALYE
jgi:hypothetical protein